MEEARLSVEMVPAKSTMILLLPFASTLSQHSHYVIAD